MAVPARENVRDPAHPRRKPDLMSPGWVLDEAVLAAERRRAYAEGYAEGYKACKAARGRLEVIGGGAAGPA